MRSPLSAALIGLLSLRAWAGSPSPAPPSDAECHALPPLTSPLAFSPGERLEFDLDAMGIAQAGKMTMKVLPARDGKLPIEVATQTNTFFSKVRRVKALATSYLDPKSLRPVRYVEDAMENDVQKYAAVSFTASDHQVRVDYKIGDRSGQYRFRYANEGLDVVGAVYLMRQMPLKQGTQLCFDLYGIRRLWRVSGKVERREHISLRLGEFEAWHLSGKAVRLDDHQQQREVHVWISDDQRRLPLVAVGAIDLGAIRATLIAFSRPGDKKARAEGKQNLKW